MICAICRGCIACFVHSEVECMAGTDRAVFDVQGKLVFLAPTKPLVHQQMDACQQFMGSSKVGPTSVPDLAPVSAELMASFKA